MIRNSQHGARCPLTTRNAVLDKIADIIATIRLDHPVRVGIDGVDCAGKTTLADDLVEPLRTRSRPIIRASVDGFHNPRAIRYRQGRTSPRGYYEDSFDLDAIVDSLLRPLGPDGTREYRTARFDFRTDSPVDCPWHTAPTDAVLLFDGVFLHRPELLPHWDFTVFVEADFETTIRRAAARDGYLFGTENATRHTYLQRYIPGQKLYLSACEPVRAAHIVLRNNSPSDPELILNRTAQ